LVEVQFKGPGHNLNEFTGSGGAFLIVCGLHYLAVIADCEGPNTLTTRVDNRMDFRIYPLNGAVEANDLKGVAVSKGDRLSPKPRGNRVVNLIRCKAGL